MKSLWFIGGLFVGAVLLVSVGATLAASQGGLQKSASTVTSLSEVKPACGCQNGTKANGEACGCQNGTTKDCGCQKGVKANGETCGCQTGEKKAGEGCGCGGSDCGAKKNKTGSTCAGGCGK